MQLLKIIAQVVAKKAVGLGLDVFTAGLGTVAIEVWDEWRKKSANDELRKKDMADVAGLSSQIAANVAKDIVRAELSQLKALQPLVEEYIREVPSIIRRTQLGSTIDGNSLFLGEFAVRNADDALLLLPANAPQRRAGDIPLAGSDWRLEELLGFGPAGEVWKAKNPCLDMLEPVVLKFITDHSAAKMLRFDASNKQKPIKFPGNSPGIVRVRNSSLLNKDQPCCIEYDFVAGGDLSSLIRQWHRTPELSAMAEWVIEQSAEIMAQLSRTLSEPHAQKCQHRDLKPSNVLVTPPATLEELESRQSKDVGWSVVNISDFGLGDAVANSAAGKAAANRLNPAQRTQCRLRGGFSSLYIAPNQGTPSPQEDIYALGVMWYQMLTNDFSLEKFDWQKASQRLNSLHKDSEVHEIIERCTSPQKYCYQDANKLLDGVNRVFRWAKDRRRLPKGCQQRGDMNLIGAGGQVVRSMPLPQARSLIGSSQSHYGIKVDIDLAGQVQDKFIAEKHALVIVDLKSRLSQIVDLGSKQGTFVGHHHSRLKHQNWIRLNPGELHPLYDMDSIKIGSALLRYEVANSKGTMNEKGQVKY